MRIKSWKYQQLLLNSVFACWIELNQWNCLLFMGMGSLQCFLWDLYYIINVLVETPDMRYIKFNSSWTISNETNTKYISTWNQKII